MAGVKERKRVMKISGKHIFDVCGDCGKIVRLNKFIFGDIHACATPEQQIEHRDFIEERYKLNKLKLSRA